MPKDRRRAQSNIPEEMSKNKSLSKSPLPTQKSPRPGSGYSVDQSLEHRPRRVRSVPAASRRRADEVLGSLFRTRGHKLLLPEARRESTGPLSPSSVRRPFLAGLGRELRSHHRRSEAGGSASRPPPPRTLCPRSRGRRAPRARVAGSGRRVRSGPGGSRRHVGREQGGGPGSRRGHVGSSGLALGGDTPQAGVSGTQRQQLKMRTRGRQRAFPGFRLRNGRPGRERGRWRREKGSALTWSPRVPSRRAAPAPGLKRLGRSPGQPRGTARVGVLPRTGEVSESREEPPRLLTPPAHRTRWEPPKPRSLGQAQLDARVSFISAS